MQIITDINNKKFSACVVSIGNFDGIHLGHQQILQQVVRAAKQANLTSAIIIFEPQPQEFFRGAQAPARLTNLAEKLFYLQQFGIQQVIVLPFDEQLKQLSAQNFIKMLHEKFQVRQLIIGDDFRFGANREGNAALLQKNFTVTTAENIMLQGERVSSSRVRAALQASDFDLAKSLLGRAYTMRGTVIHGDKQGRKIAVPTANIDPQRLVLPLRGVFAVKVHGLDKAYRGVANLGTRPTVDGIKQLLETHIFDFDQDIYEQEIEVEFVTKIRDEKKFENFAELTQQIQHDIQQAKINMLS